MRTARNKQRHVVDLQLASMVIAMRVPVMMMENITDKLGRSETNRAVSEKIAATADGAVSAQLSLMNSGAMFWLNIMRGKSPAGLVVEAVNKATEAAIRPGRATLRANYKRLMPGA